MAKTPFVPFGPNVVLELLPKEEVTKGGLVIPESVKETQTYVLGKVIAVGHGYRNSEGVFMPNLAKAGDVVMFNKHAGTKIFFQGKDYHLIHDHEIWAKIAE